MMEMVNAGVKDRRAVFEEMTGDLAAHEHAAFLPSRLSGS